MQTRFEQSRVSQLVGNYTPFEPPRSPLDFGDLLSLMWRLDQSANAPHHERYYRNCALALCRGLHLQAHPLFRFIDLTDAGDIYRLLPAVIHRVQGRSVDTHDRKAALDQLLRMRGDILRVGTYQEGWTSNWPGSGMQDVEMRERVFAVLFTALQGQFAGFGRLLLVTDIVIANLIIGLELPDEIALSRLVKDYNYPDPSSKQNRDSFAMDGI